MKCDTDKILGKLNQEPSIEECTESVLELASVGGSPSATNAKVLHTLATVTVPALYEGIRYNNTHARLKDCLIRCFAGVAGLRIICNSIQRLSQSAEIHRSSRTIKLYLEFLQDILESSYASLGNFWRGCHHGSSTGPNALWEELVALVAGERMVGAAAEASIKVNSFTPRLHDTIWISNSRQYAIYLGGQLAFALNDMEIPTAAISRFLGRCCSIGHSKELFRSCYEKLLRWGSIHLMTGPSALLRPWQMTLLLDRTFQVLKQYGIEKDQAKIGSAASLLLKSSNSGALKDWLTGSLSSQQSVNALRSLVLAFNEITSDDEKEKACLDLLSLWSTRAYIDKTPILYQISVAQAAVILSAYLSEGQVKRISHSQAFSDGISNHLAASDTEIRSLAIYVGEAVSARASTDEKLKLKFNVPQSENALAHEFRSLACSPDTLAPVEHLLQYKDSSTSIRADDKVRSEEDLPTFSRQSPAVQHRSTDTDSDGFRRYALPDSDEEDSDDDPTIERSKRKLSKPLYIRSLIEMLKDESYESHNLALGHAADLISAKASYGTELLEHAVPLLRTLSTLSDSFDIPQFEELRQQSLIAMGEFLPDVSVPFLMTVFFSNNVSQQQRLAILSSIGIAARRLSGIEAGPVTQAPQAVNARHRIHSSYKSEIDDMATGIESVSLQPIATDAAQTVDGPRALQVRKFSRRLDLEAKKKKPSSNKLSLIVESAFIRPFTRGWWTCLREYFGRSAHFEPIILEFFIKVLTVIVDATTPTPPPNYLSLISEVWDVLFSARSASLKKEDKTVQCSIVLGFLAIMNALEGDLIASELTSKLVETHQYCAELFDSSSDGEKVHVLSAATLLKTKELLEKHHVSMMGRLLEQKEIDLKPQLGQGKFGLAGL